MRSAYNDAIGYAREALRLIATMPESRERDQKELKLQMMLGPLIVTIQGFSSPELAISVGRAQEICRVAGERPEIFGVLARLWSFDHANRPLREVAWSRTNCCRWPGAWTAISPAGAHNAMAATQIWMGEFIAARENFEISAKIFDRDLPRYLPMMQTPVTPSRCHFAWALHIGGFPEQAKRRIDGQRVGAAAAPSL